MNSSRADVNSMLRRPDLLGGKQLLPIGTGPDMDAIAEFCRQSWLENP